MTFTIFYCAHFYIVQRLTENQHQQQVVEDGKDVEPGEDEEDGLLQDTGEVGIPPSPISQCERPEPQVLTRPQTYSSTS